ncbi:YhcH/YjgK/YiaL family protein [Lederbergia wuyishanensis]|uniref:YhcH/YjgK/YiaL family protein n=1 Tax=Lederbergia wuyishanensis TaxID=1347903 RepID=A0ABU0D7Y5_9BACI|nr:YhcH/YjgK/YiaL family protein [Lederbergia wuyishanensis]MCJ8009329.1 YhcH/YjgK/YiaL family protein [Lederbergia wuyishanensis]MDQ0344537.1 YhcH/YjgK/YiaL family protein [Lederbergia wuyishanensis]
MIFDKLENLAQYTFNNQKLNSALQDIIAGRVEEENKSDDFQKNKIAFTTTSLNEKRYEAHKNYIDIHIVLDGKEYVEVANVQELMNTTEYDADNDIFFGDVVSDNKFCGYLQKGYALICFPEDTHLVGAHKEVEENISKVVYKILYQ